MLHRLILRAAIRGQTGYAHVSKHRSELIDKLSDIRELLAVGFPGIDIGIAHIATSRGALGSV